jgi:hypothetical protein
LSREIERRAAYEEVFRRGTWHGASSCCLLCRNFFFLQRMNVLCVLYSYLQFKLVSNVSIMIVVAKYAAVLCEVYKYKEYNYTIWLM